MSMTREEAISSYEKLYDYMVGDDDAIELDYGEFMELNHYIRSALRPVSREQIEKVWRGEWIVQQDEHKEYIKKCSKCGFPISRWWGADKFCANCGEAFTDEAVDMMLERMREIWTSE